MLRLPKPVAFGACLIFTLLASSALAQTDAPPPAPQPSPAMQYLSQRLFPNTTLDNFLERLRNEFRGLDADMNGVVDDEDSKIHAAVAMSQMRAMYTMLILRADLNDDGVVTEDELRRMMRYERRQMARLPNTANTQQIEDQFEAEIKKLMVADADRDGRITYAEALAYSRKHPDFARNLPGMSNMVKLFLVLAPEGKNAVTLADIEPAAEALFRLVDSDSDGKISQDELKAYRARPDQPDEQRRRAAQAAMQDRELKRRAAEAARAKTEQETRVVCAMPKASEAAKVVMVGAYQAEALSSSTIGSQDISVGVGNVTVEAGSEPLYLVLVSFRPTIWRFYGAIERIERLVLTGTMTGPGRGEPEQKPAVGAVGVPAERISFLGQSKCIGYFTESRSSQSAVAAAVVRREAGKDVDVIAARYGFADVSIPAGRFQATRDSDSGKLVIIKPAGSLKIEGNPNNVIVRAGPGSLESEFKRFSPGGVIEIDPKRVVAAMPVEKYEVLPQQAGLLQLLKEGKLEQNGSGEFLIKQKIRFPAELNGAHSVKFLLLRGVSKPDGDPGHSEVFSEETGEKVNFEPKK